MSVYRNIMRKFCCWGMVGHEWGMVGHEWGMVGHEWGTSGYEWVRVGYESSFGMPLSMTFAPLSITTSVLFPIMLTPVLTIIQSRVDHRLENVVSNEADDFPILIDHRFRTLPNHLHAYVDQHRLENVVSNEVDDWFRYSGSWSECRD